MLTSTVRNSSLASIMRTGICASGTPACRALSACSSSVWPGYWSQGLPAACSASLCSGAVTMAATSPRKAARVAQSTHSPASWPARASTTPQGNAGAGATTCNTGKQPAGTANASAAFSISSTGNGTPHGSKATARRITPTSPATKQPRTSGACSRQVRAMISGPMPHGSPGVRTMGWSCAPVMLGCRSR